MNRKEFEKKYNVNIDDAYDTGCPFLRIINVWRNVDCGNYDLVYFVAQKQDPCPLKKCGMIHCYNFGKNYDNPERLIINP